MRSISIALAVAHVMALSIASAEAAPRQRTQQDIARTDCARQADTKHYAPRTVKRRNFVRDCMVDKGFQSR
jgi:Ni/Co efflux regulator RcnB